MHHKNSEYNESGSENKDRGNLTDRQSQVLGFIRATIEQKGYPPTIRDIANHLDIVSLNAVRRHLKSIEKKGYIHVEPGKSRGIKLLDEVSSSQQAKVPLVGKIAAGPFSLADEDIEEHLIMDPDFWGEPEDLFLLKVKGDSMEPHIKEGDMVVVKRQSYAAPGEIIVALVENEATVKQIILKDTRYFLHPFNPAYEDISTGEDFRINGKVTGLIRRY
ncbi:MAG: transcriptional repressor LexA [Candidatus Eremiobacteraeota bacterium]|nr:transcriptional repressor LexA [Candidatus Eremiobacteraeota bacterium]